MLSTRGLILVTCSAVLGGCSGLRTLSSDVASYGDWPAGRQGGSYAFERLPSQAAQPAATDALEAAAAPALAKAGFTPVAEGRQPDVLVQVGARSQRTLSPWDDPLWWRGGFGYWRHGPWLSPRWGMSVHGGFPRYEREVAVLLRDRASGKPLFEARASHEGNLRDDAGTTAALFEAALADFPRLGVNPRRVVVQVPS